MLFPTFDFAIFFAIAFTVNWLLNPHPGPWKLSMIALSYVFYGWVGWSYCLLLLATTLMAQIGGVTISAARTERSRRLALGLSCVGLLGLLGWFKYYGFVSVNLDNVSHALGLGRAVPLLQVALPIAISFFTFMALSYVIDIYRRQLEPARPLDLALYLSFFPHLLAGPIVRGNELLPQLRKRRDPAAVDYSRALWLIMAGLFKKVVISSYVASAIVTPVFTAPSQHSALESIFAAWGYAVQIYCDFSGYTDIAIGLALLLGIRFPVNFDAPYTARNLQDFWRRWHITLSRWLRDYLYIPLGGSSGSESRTVRNIMITMVLGGLWHGAAWTFIFWGALHGVGQGLGHVRRRSRVRRGLPAVAEGPVRVWVQRFLTFQFVCLGWVFFNSSGLSEAFAVLGRLGSGWGQPSALITPLLVVVVLGALAVQYVPTLRVDRLQASFSRQHAAVQVGLLSFALLGITTFGPAGVAPFIYYRF
ncbi:MAG TPA: MBOAT family O-acyltransferase [Acidimicrobiales bacterium]|jgi:D-alanyl-lipoteichoic acid acyltransferase DltB (MBOAT superfamily)|nr:MBOAT family O-acyltransferase [Acidimicrobiales bacterium]